VLRTVDEDGLLGQDELLDGPDALPSRDLHQLLQRGCGHCHHIRVHLNLAGVLVTFIIAGSVLSGGGKLDNPKCQADLIAR
jgi:hypothetical protein